MTHSLSLRSGISASATPVSGPRCGVSGWMHSGWDRAVFPRPQARGFHPLEFLAQRLDTLEIDSTLYQFHRPELVKLWGAKVSHNDQFKFTARLHRQFTHERQLDDASVALFTQSLRPLLDRGQLGALLMQFPSSFRFTGENRDFLIRLRRAFSGFPLVAELRHASWTVEEAIGTLVDYKVGFCNLDQPRSLRATSPASWLTTRVGYVKLYGPAAGTSFGEFDDREATRNGQRTGHNHFFSLAEMEAWQPRIEHLRRFAEEVYVVFANDGGGKSVINALQMQSLLGGERLTAPARPQVAAAAVAQSPAAPALFDVAA